VDNVGAITSATSTATTTDDTTPGINIGALPAGSTGAVLYVDGTAVAATYNAATGALTPNTALAPGLHALTYSLTDAAGNQSGQSPALTLTVDTSPGHGRLGHGFDHRRCGHTNRRDRQQRDHR
jgi:hypothetical protein